LNTLGSEHDGLHTTSTDLVDGGSVGASAHACTEGDLTSGRLTDTGLNDITKVNLLYNSRIDVLGGKSVLESDDTELRGLESFEGTVDGTGRGTRRGDDDNFGGLRRNELGGTAAEKVQTIERARVDR